MLVTDRQAAIAAVHGDHGDVVLVKRWRYRTSEIADALHENGAA